MNASAELLVATKSFCRTSGDIDMAKSNEYSEKEAQARFEAALKGALNTPHKLLKEKPKVKKVTKKAKGDAKKKP